MPYAHWITFLIRKAITVKSPEMMAEYTGATTEFLPYNMTQMLRHSSVRTPRQLSRRLEVPEIVVEQDEIIGCIVVIGGGA